MSIVLRAIADNWPTEAYRLLERGRVLEHEAERDALASREPAVAIRADIHRAIALFAVLYKQAVPYLAGVAEGVRVGKGGRPNKRVDTAVGNMVRATIVTPEDAKQAYKVLLDAQIASVDKSVVLLQQAADALNEAIDCYYEQTTPDLFGADSALRRFAKYSGAIIGLSSDNAVLSAIGARAREMASRDFVEALNHTEESAVLLSFCSAIGVVVNLTGTGRERQHEQARLDLLTRWLLGKAGLVARRSLRGIRLSTKDIGIGDLEQWAQALGAPAAGRAGRAGRGGDLLMPPVARFLVSLVDALGEVMLGDKIDALCGSIVLLFACADDCGIAEEALVDEATELLADMMVA